jgi:hypothetical protein
MVAHTCDLSTWEVGAGGLQFQSHLGIHSESLSSGKKKKRERERRKKKPLLDIS